jgi:hypothetical protein
VGRNTKRSNDLPTQATTKWILMVGAGADQIHDHRVQVGLSREKINNSNLNNGGGFEHDKGA